MDIFLHFKAGTYSYQKVLTTAATWDAGKVYAQF
jgi:hypothetical protein